MMCTRIQRHTNVLELCMGSLSSVDTVLLLREP